MALGVFSLAACAGDPEVDEPEPLGDHVPIEYPLEMWDQGIEGETVLQVRVNELGEVDSVAVVETSGHQALDSAAAKGARAMRFNPGRRGGRDVPVWVRIPVHFARQANPQL
jgi:protein TonB